MVSACWSHPVPTSPGQSVLDTWHTVTGNSVPVLLSSVTALSLMPPGKRGCCASAEDADANGADLPRQHFFNAACMCLRGWKSSPSPASGIAALKLVITQSLRVLKVVIAAQWSSECSSHALHIASVW